CVSAATGSTTGAADHASAVFARRSESMPAPPRMRTSTLDHGANPAASRDEKSAEPDARQFAASSAATRLAMMIGYVSLMRSISSDSTRWYRALRFAVSLGSGLEECDARCEDVRPCRASSRAMEADDAPRWSGGSHRVVMRSSHGTRIVRANAG